MGFDSDFRQELEFQNLLLFGYLQMMKDKEKCEAEGSNTRMQPMNERLEESCSSRLRGVPSEIVDQTRPISAKVTESKLDGGRPMSNTANRIRPSSRGQQKEPSCDDLGKKRSLSSKKRPPSARSDASLTGSIASSDSTLNKSISKADFISLFIITVREEIHII